jgi:hypothetical protein
VTDREAVAPVIEEVTMSERRSRGLPRPAAVAAGLVLAALVPGLPAGAELCSVDQVPAATVLVPYFEVDLDDPGGLTTLFDLVNALPEAVLVRVTLWTDLAIPTFAFDVYLTGYDLQSFNLRDLFIGLVPVTGGPVLGVPGRFSRPTAPFPGCDGAILPEVPAAHLVAAHRGLGSPLLGGQCAGLRHDDGHARGYVTADVVGECGSDLFPSDPGYFGPGGVARHANALWGDYYRVDPSANFAYAESLVRIESDPEAFGEGDRTFYGRYVGYSGIDGREPLPSAWGVRTLNGPPFDDLHLVVWREVPGPPLPFPCGDRPDWYPLPLETVLVFDEEENVFDPRNLPVSPPVILNTPAVIRERGFFAQTGWWYADLDQSQVRPVQGYVNAEMGAGGRYSVGVGATPLGSGCGPQGCDLGTEAPATRLCVFGAFRGDTTLDPGEPVLFEVAAGGCHSRSCIGFEQAACAVGETAGGDFEVDSRICLAPTGYACLPVCDYQPATECLTRILGAGTYTVHGAGQELTFTVPSSLPAGGLCAGSAEPAS